MSPGACLEARFCGALSDRFTAISGSPPFPAANFYTQAVPTMESGRYLRGTLLAYIHSEMDAAPPH